MTDVTGRIAQSSSEIPKKWVERPLCADGG